MSRNYLLSGVALFAMAVLLAVSVQAQATKAPSRPAAATPAASIPNLTPAPPGALPPLPRVSFQPSMPMPVIQQVYEFAARHPEVLSYVPCYCGCESVGHKANHDCFVKQRAANGRIVEWDSHGIGCAVCLGVGRRAMALFNEGKTVAQIRAAIDQEFGVHYPSHTPTPTPSKATKKS